MKYYVYRGSEESQAVPFGTQEEVFAKADAVFDSEAEALAYIEDLDFWEILPGDYFTKLDKEFEEQQ